ncbi:MAG: S8 family serine peptidase [Terriglobia bacterium]
MRRLAVFAFFSVFAVNGFARDLTRYVLILSDPAAAQSRGRVAMEAARVRNVNAHKAVKSELRTRNIAITSETHTLLNAIFVAADSAQLDDLKSIPGVQYVARVPRFHRNLDHAEQLIGVPTGWNLVGGMGNAGAGIKIGIIDTGIESTHPAFHDLTLTPPESFPLCSIATPTQGPAPQTMLDCAQFTNNKIIVARSYVPLVAQGAAASSRPDDYSPRDRTGHGTAVAMAAAGVTNTGPADTITGVAPKAFLGSYKVFGSPGVNDFASADAVIAALEDAFIDGMDIAVLSLGAPSLAGPQDSGQTCGYSAGAPCDPEAAAVQNAVNAGMVVVAAAGNEGDSGLVQPTLGTADSPGDAPNAIAVAATTNSHQWSNLLTVNGIGTIRSLLGGGPSPSDTLNAPLSHTGTVGDPLACNALPAGSLTGTYALVGRGICTFVVKVQNLAAAGAAGAIITNSEGDNSIFVPGSLGGATTIPAAVIGYDDGQNIRAYLAANPQATARMRTILQPFEAGTANQVAAFSSRGPVLGSGALKPDVAAPGTDLYLAAQTYDPNGELYSANGYLVGQGTSFSAPQVAGIAALVKQVNPQFTALQIKSAIVNTATQDVTDNGATASFLATGAGKANAGNAVAANLTANPTSASFGILGAGRLPLTQQILLTNSSASALNVSISLNRRTAENNAHTSIDLPNLIIPAGQSSPINLLLSGTVPSPGIYEGFVLIQGAATTLQIPYLYLVGDGIPANIVSILGDGDDGTVGKAPAEAAIIIKLSDRYGVPIANAPVKFSVVSGGGSLRNQDPSTDIYGLAGASPVLGPVPGTNEYAAAAGGLTTTFTDTARALPTILSKGVVDAAGFQPGVAVAPGSYIAVFGTSLSPVTQTFTTRYLPVSIASVSASFDTPLTSAPGHLYFVTPGQINLQVPWELQGQTSAQMKISVQDSSGNIYNLPLATYSPGIFPIQIGGVNYAAARDQDFKVISPSNPAKQGASIQIYCNGLGPVGNQPATGEPASSTQLSRTLATPTVTIGGFDAPVSFSGLTPTAIGLYQLNVTVPNTGPGTKRVVVTIGGIAGNALNLVVQ